MWKADPAIASGSASRTQFQPIIPAPFCPRDSASLSDKKRRRENGPVAELKMPKESARWRCLTAEWRVLTRTSPKCCGKQHGTVYFATNRRHLAIHRPSHKSPAHSELTSAAQKSTVPIVPPNAASPSLTSRKTGKDNDTCNMRFTGRLLRPGLVPLGTPGLI